MRSVLVTIGLSLLACHVPSLAQGEPKAAAAVEKAAVSVEAELKRFYDGYADDLRQQKGAAVAERFDDRGYYRMGNGSKELVTFADAKTVYTTRWAGPKAFEWRDLSFEVLSPDAASVVGLFDWTRANGMKTTMSYTAVLSRRNGQWRIRVEDESFNTAGYSTKLISGNPATPGVVKLTMTAQAGTSMAPHKHTTEMKITVKSGRKFVIVGDLVNAKVQSIDAGSAVVIPANTWHLEWWEVDTVEEVETTSPTATVRALPGSPRTP